jgi:hypothetical protein
MEIRLSLGLLALLGVLAYSLTFRAPQAAVEPAVDATQDLADLEDAFAIHRDDLPLARQLSGAYLKIGSPGLAIGVVQAVSPELVTDPLLTHRLAQAYEAVGRLDDALVTAAVAHGRCLRAVGSLDATTVGAPPRFDCSPAVLVALEQHEQALSQMLRWGVTDPRDPRAIAARGMAERRARIASLDSLDEL